MDGSQRLRTAGVSWRALEDHQKKNIKLSYCQQSSLEVLQEWLQARQSDPNVESDAKEAERRMSGGPRARNVPTYHDILARLKYSEFYNKPFGAGIFKIFLSPPELSELAPLRRQATYYAACERIASAYWSSNPPARNALVTRNQPRHGASIVPEIRLERESPYYLWDSQYQKVREVEEIIRTEGSCPDYVVISHSWVRWRDTSASWLQIPGVPWTIPQNSKFDVEKLPQMISALPWRYIWIDLLTIPQGLELETHMRERQDWEIKCVPQLFRNALKALVWFDDIPSWSSLPAALEYLSVQYLSASARTGIDRGRLSSSLKTAASAADKPLELLNHDKSRKTPALDIWDPNGWFTSPWSFQEIIMRPDILLCNDNWEFLEIRKGVPVALNDIAALLKVSSETDKTNLPQPLAVQELHQLFERTGFFRLLELTRETSVGEVEKISGCSPINARGYPCIVSSGGYANPHNMPSKDEPRLIGA